MWTICAHIVSFLFSFHFLRLSWLLLNQYFQFDMRWSVWWTRDLCVCMCVWRSHIGAECERVKCKPDLQSVRCLTWLSHQMKRVLNAQFYFHIFLCCIIFSHYLSVFFHFLCPFACRCMRVHTFVFFFLSLFTLFSSILNILPITISATPLPSPLQQNQISCCYSSHDNLCDICCFWCFHISLGSVIINWIVMSWFRP